MFGNYLGINVYTNVETDGELMKKVEEYGAIMFLDEDVLSLTFNHKGSTVELKYD